jgi:hypothetical protein
MHSKPYSLLALLFLLLLLAMGMSCSGFTNTNSSGSGGDASLVGTWNLQSSTGGVYPRQIILNTGGGGSYVWNNGTQGINWSQSGSQVNITIGQSPTSVSIQNLTYPVGNTFTLTGVSGSGVYTR